MSGTLDEQWGSRLFQSYLKATDRLDHLIKDLLEYARTGNLNIAFQELSVEDLLTKFLEPHQSVIESKKLVLTIQRPLGKVIAHKVPLSTALENILLNAIKFVSPDNPPVIKIWTESVSGNRLKICIQDNGIGIPPEHQQRIFNFFERLHGTTATYEGTGAGLAIAKRAVERMGGTIGVSSELAKGSLFWIELKAVT